ncbi:MAG: radical SAM protein [Myxococcales bacterium]|nr:MAG: radical SAM protein [Myxococcales bacterium]
MVSSRRALAKLPPFLAKGLGEHYDGREWPRRTTPQAIRRRSIVKTRAIMQRIDIKIGFDCNNKCFFCVQGDKRYHYPNKTTEEVKKILGDARRETDSIVFTGGEVTIRPDFPELVRHAASLGFARVQVQTNGRAFASKKYCETIVRAGANEFSPAIHGPRPEIHDYLVNAAGAFKQTVMGIRNLKEMGQIVIMNSVITRPNYRHLPETARLFVALKVDQFQFAFVHALGSAGKNFEMMVPRKSLIEPYLKRALQIGIQAGCRVMTEAIPYCFMEGFEANVAERYIPHTKIIDADWVVDDYTEYRWTEGKAKGPNCGECAYFDECEGPWKEYPEAYGWSEFIPRKTKAHV